MHVYVMIAIVVAQVLLEAYTRTQNRIDESTTAHTHVRRFNIAVHGAVLVCMYMCMFNLYYNSYPYTVYSRAVGANRQATAIEWHIRIEESERQCRRQQEEKKFTKKTSYTLNVYTYM